MYPQIPLLQIKGVMVEVVLPHIEDVVMEEEGDAHLVVAINHNKFLNPTLSTMVLMISLPQVLVVFLQFLIIHNLLVQHTILGSLRITPFFYLLSNLYVSWSLCITM